MIAVQIFVGFLCLAAATLACGLVLAVVLGVIEAVRIVWLLAHRRQVDPAWAVIVALLLVVCWLVGWAVMIP